MDNERPETAVEEREKGKNPTIRDAKKLGGAWYQAVLSLVSVILGGAMLFVPGVQARGICYAGCLVLLAVGLVYVAIYFITGAYRRLRDRHFALGVLMLLLGVCGLIRLDALAGAFRTYLGVASLLLGIMLLQDTVQLTVLGSRWNILELIWTLLILFASVCLIAQFKAVLDLREDLPQLTLFIAGLLSFLSLGITALVVGKIRREEGVLPGEAPVPPHVEGPIPTPPEREEGAGN